MGISVAVLTIDPVLKLTEEVYLETKQEWKNLVKNQTFY